METEWGALCWPWTPLTACLSFWRRATECVRNSASRWGRKAGPKSLDQWPHLKVRLNTMPWAPLYKTQVRHGEPSSQICAFCTLENWVRKSYNLFTLCHLPVRDKSALWNRLYMSELCISIYLYICVSVHLYIDSEKLIISTQWATSHLVLTLCSWWKTDNR